MPFKNARKTSTAKSGGASRARTATKRSKRSTRTTRVKRAGKSRSVGGKKTRRRKRTKQGGIGMPPSTPIASSRAHSTAMPKIVGKHARRVFRTPTPVAAIPVTPAPRSTSQVRAQFMTPGNRSSQTAAPAEHYGIVPVNLGF